MPDLRLHFGQILAPEYLCRGRARLMKMQHDPVVACQTLALLWAFLPNLTRVKSGRACLPRQARQPRQPDRRAPIYQQSECDASLACRLAASSNRVGRSPTGGPLVRPSDPCRCAEVKVRKPFPSIPEPLQGMRLRGGILSRGVHFTAPIVRPAMKCFCIMKNMITGGRAARIEPAETRCHCAIH